MRTYMTPKHSFAF